MKIKPMIYQVDRKMELLYKGEYRGYNYYILNLGTHPTAYVEIPEGHKLFGKHYNRIDINVHGGLTYSDSELINIKSKGWFIGWDYAHAGDYMGYYEDFKRWGINNLNNLKDDKKWTTEEIIEDCKSVINQINEMENKEIKIVLNLNKSYNNYDFKNKKILKDFLDNVMLKELWDLYNKKILNDDYQNRLYDILDMFNDYKIEK